MFRVSPGVNMREAVNACSKRRSRHHLDGHLRDRSSLIARNAGIQMIMVTSPLRSGDSLTLHQACSLFGTQRMCGVCAQAGMALGRLRRS